MSQHAQPAQHSDENVHALFDEHESIMLLIDPHTGAIRNANHAATRFYAYPRTELCTMSIGQICTAELEHLAILLQQALRKEQNYFVVEHRVASGQLRTVEVQASPVSLDGQLLLFCIIHDITERVRTEQALRQSELRYRTLFDTLNVSICRWLPDTTLIFANQQYRSIFGIEGDPTGRQWLEFVPDATREEAAVFYRELARNPGTVTYEHPVTVEDGQERHYQWIDTPIFDDNHQLLEFQSVGIDITERRHVEELGRAQRDLARIIGTVKSSNEAWTRCLAIALRVTGMDSGGIYLFSSDYHELQLVAHHGLNDEFIRLTSLYSVESRNVQMILSGTACYFGTGDIHALPFPQSEDVHALALVPIQYQGRVIGCINLASHTLHQVSPFHRSALEIIATEIANIVVYLRTEESLRESEELYRTLINSQESEISTLDADGVFHYINQIGARSFGLTPRTMIGKRLDDVFPAQIAVWQLAQIRQVITSGQGMVVEVQLQLPGEPRWYRTSIQPIRDTDGRVVLAMINAMDINERKQAEQQLRESQLRVELALKGANMGMWDWYVQTGHTVFNERWAEIIGYTLAELEPISIQTWINLCHPDDLACSNALLEQHFAGESVFYQCEARLRHKDGHWVWVIDRGKVVEWDTDGKPVRMSGTHLDITERKQAEQALLELNQTLEQRVRQRTAEVQDIYENAPIGYHSLDANGIILMVNQTELNWLGYTREEMLGQSFAHFLTPSSLAVFARNFPSFKERGSVRDLEFEMIRKDRSVLPVLLSATAIYNEHGEYVMSRSGVFDNSERKRAEDALRESEEQNRLLFEESPDAVVLFREDGVLVQLNRAFEQLSGYQATHLVGQTLDRVGLIPRETALQLLDVITQQTGSNAVQFALPINQASGEVRDIGVRVFGLPIRGKQHYLATMRDITTEKQVEETLRQANAELARAARTKDEFLANMSHELRTPLNAVLGLSEMLVEEVYGPINAQQQDKIHIIESSGRHLLSLINDILDVSKIEAGRLDLQVEAVNVAEVCQASLLFVKEQAIKKSLRLTFFLNNQMAQMEADPRRLKQMLINLLTNAVKFTPDRGEVHLKVDVDAEARVIRFVVQDTGIGIAASDLARLFQPFQQLDSSLSRQHEGTGLGLALVRRLAEIHGGSVVVESTLKQGSCFTISLPYRRPRPGRREGHQPPSGLGSPTNLPHLALGAEESESAVELLARYLQEASVRVFVHQESEGALEEAIRLQPDVIFLDVLLVGRSGWEMLSHLKGNPYTRNIPVVIVSDGDDHVHGLAAGASEYMVKPITRETLHRVLGVVAAPNELEVRQALVIVPHQTPPPTDGVRILLVEDNEVNLLTISDYLQARGYVLSVARNGDEALNRVDEVHPELILMDIQMPRMDGLEATRRLRAMPAYAHVPIIALTALAMPGDRERCIQAGANEYLAKPVSLSKLVEIIREMLEG